MATSRRTLLKNSAAAAAALSFDWTRAQAQAETVRIGLIYDLTGVFKDKNLHYVFRAQIHSDQYGQAFAGFLAEHAKAKLGMEPKDVRIALIHEDGPYGVGVAAADEAYAKEAGLQVVLREGYSAAAPDLSVLITKLKRAKADVISHAGYN